jgi:hypothetical protein
VAIIDWKMVGCGRSACSSNETRAADGIAAIVQHATRHTRAPRAHDARQIGRIRAALEFDGHVENVLAAVPDRLHTSPAARPDLEHTASEQRGQYEGAIVNRKRRLPHVAAGHLNIRKKRRDVHIAILPLARHCRIFRNDTSRHCDGLRQRYDESFDIRTIDAELLERVFVAPQLRLPRAA